MPGERLAAAQDSVAVAITLGRTDPELLAAAQDAFLDGLHAGCLLVSAVCLAGAVVAAVALPGRRFVGVATALRTA